MSFGRVERAYGGGGDFAVGLHFLGGWKKDYFGRRKIVYPKEEFPGQVLKKKICFDKSIFEKEKLDFFRKILSL